MFCLEFLLFNFVEFSNSHNLLIIMHLILAKIYDYNNR